jgi:Na+-translocating ferredoxin:NAD+ oxidoreductase subunit G
MKEMIHMVVVLTLLSSLSGWVLAALRDGTREKIEMQELNLVKGPAVRTILEGATNDPLTDRFKVKDGETERNIFVGVFDGTPSTVAFEVTGKGFADAIGIMVAVNVDEDKIVGVGVTTSKETPGLGGNAKSDPSFAAQFKGLSFDQPLTVTKDGGKINAISGATITSRAVCAAVTDAEAVYARIKPELTAKLKAFSN